MLEHTHPTIVGEDTSHFRHPLEGVGHAAEHQTANHGVETAGAKGQRFGSTHNQWDSGTSVAGSLQQPQIELETDDRRFTAVQLQVATGSASQIENSTPGSPDQTPTPSTQSRPFDDFHKEVVSPGNLLDSAHQSADFRPL
jgi:hypothetical protein